MIELKEICPYLPYGLKVTFEGDEYSHTIVGVEDTTNGIRLISPFNDYGQADISKVKPILRPLSDLTREIEHNGEKFIPMEKLEGGYGFIDFKYGFVKNQRLSVYQISYWIVEKLLSWHMDVFNLISRGLAVDYNTVNQNV